MNFDDAFDALIGNEGGYSNDPNDPGAETMWGCTARVARAHGYHDEMKDLPRDTVKGWARSDYWDAARCDQLPAIIAFDMFDTAYNSGVHEAVTILQRAAGAVADGALGPQTLAAAAAVPGEALRRLFNAERLSFLTQVPVWQADSRGLANRIANNLKRVQP